MKSNSKSVADSAEAENTRPSISSVSAGTALRLGEAGASDANLSPAQKRFNALLARIDKLKAQIADIQTMADAHRVVYLAAIPPLRQSNERALNELTLWLDERLQRGGLPDELLMQGTTILLRLCASFAERGDDEMRALHDKRSPESLEELKLARMAQTQKKMEAFFASNPDEFGESGSAGEGDVYDADFEEALDDLQEAVQAKRAQRRGEGGFGELGSEKDSRNRGGKSSEKAQKQQQKEQLEATTILRTVYRQLASALHPDRELDAAEQKRKTGLMSEANAAYGRQDLMALLHIQLRIEQTSSQSLMQLPKEKMVAMSLLLKSQADELKEVLRGHQQMLIYEFNLSPYDTLTAGCLRSNLRYQQGELEQYEYDIRCDLHDMKKDVGLKRWIKRETRLANRDRRD
jgi:hypothetical protein